MHRSGGAKRGFGRNGQVQAGQVLLLFAASLPALLAIFALAVDLGGAAIMYHRAQVALDAAAFAGAQVLEIREYAGGQKVAVNPGQAAAAANGTLNENMAGIPMRASFSVAGDRLVGSATAYYHPYFLGAFGIGEIPCRVFSSATPGWGIDEEHQ